MIPKLELIEVTKRYGKIRALDHVSLTFVPGVYGLLGPNGAGKSTLMKIITDSIRASSGEVLFCEREIRQWKRLYRAALGYMPQQQGIYEEFTARRFLTYMALLKDIPKPEIEKEIERVLELVHLSGCRPEAGYVFRGNETEDIDSAGCAWGSEDSYLRRADSRIGPERADSHTEYDFADSNEPDRDYRNACGV